MSSKNSDYECSDSASSSDSESSSSSSSSSDSEKNTLECITTKIKRGHRGKKGCTGPAGPVGPIGLTGLSGEIGPIGPIGPIGLTGLSGEIGPIGPIGPIGLTGPIGPIGISGPVGPTGPSFALSYADYYALMPGDNSATIAVGGDVEFPSDGPFLGGDITRLGPSSFNLVSIGTYQILFQVSIDEPGQLVVSLNNLQQTYTTVGRATGTTQITGICLIQTLTSNSTLTIRNPAGNSTALTITPNAGGAGSVSAHLLIMCIN